VIKEEIVHDDGVEQNLHFVIEGQLATGKLLPSIEVSVEAFGQMEWPLRRWGKMAVVKAGLGTKDHLRAAILQCSPGDSRRVVYSHTGWVKIKGSWHYLHANGAIGSQGLVDSVSVDLPHPTLKSFKLPAPPTGKDLVVAVRGGLDLLRDLGPDTVMFPLKMSIVHTLLSSGGFNIHLSGKTSSFKTELAALVQQFWGAGMNARNLPGHWSATGNFLEMLGFHLKDAAFVIDDFCPTGSMYEIGQYHRKADQVFRGASNSGGRGRLRRDGTLGPDRPPRGQIFSTGEDVPRGQSLRARLMVVEVARDEINISRLTACQQQAADGVYAAANAGWIHWLAGRYDEAVAELTTRRAQLRDEILKKGGSRWHGRTPTAVADLIASWELYLSLTIARAVFAFSRGC
jgi:hypothetical protein